MTNKTTPLLTVQSPGNSLANTGLLVMACAPNHYLLNAAASSVQWFAWSVSSPPSFQIANTSGGTPQAGFALVDLAVLFPPSDAQTLFSAIQNNKLSLPQRTMLLGAVIASVGYLTGNGWMTQMWNDIKARQVYQVCVPGTHDAGTAVTTYATTFSNACNTQTQSLTVYQQLMAGARYLDLRPCWWAGSPLYAAPGFYLTHYTEKLGTYWGALGQTLQSALNDIQQFLQGCGTHEIVFLKFSHFAELGELNSIVRPLSTSQFNQMIQMVTNTLGTRLYKVSAGTSVNSTPLQSIAPSGATALALFSLGSSTEFGLPQSLFNPSGGILCYADTAVGLGNLQVIPNFYMYDLYANTNVFATMVSDQQAKFNKFNANGSSSFLLSWTMTCQNLNCTGNNGNCINGMAQYANPQLATYIDQWTQSKTITASKIPNVLYLDYFGQYGDHAVDVAAALNTLYGPQRAG